MATSRSRFILCLVLLVGGMTGAQSVIPPIAEYRGLKAEGSFTIGNNGDKAMSVTLETKSLVVDLEGKPIFSSIPDTLNVNLGSSSFIIAPHDTHTVFYKAVSTVTPVSFSIIPTMTPIDKVKGIKVNFRIPHTIYLYQKTKLSKSDVHVSMASGKVTIINSSSKLGRVQFIHVGSEDLHGFPIYPGQTREIAVSGDKATVHFEEGFNLEVR